MAGHPPSIPTRILPRWPAAAILAALLLLPGAAALTETISVAEGEDLQGKFGALDIETILFTEWNASAPVDVFVLTPEQYRSYVEDVGWSPKNASLSYALNESAGKLSHHVPARQAIVVVLDNSVMPIVDDGAWAKENVTVTWALEDLRATRATGLGDLVKAATFAEPYWEIPGFDGLGIASQAILFLAIAIWCEVVAWREDKKRWIDLGIMIGLAAVVTSFVSSKGVILPDTRLLTVPAALLSIYGLKRYQTQKAAAAGIFAAAFWGPFIGADLFSSIMHRGEIAAASREGSIYVIGGAGWADALVIVPAIALVGFGYRTLLFRRRAGRQAAAKVAALAPTLTITNARRDGGDLLLDVTNPTGAALRPAIVRLAAGDGRPASMQLELTLEPHGTREIRVVVPRALEKARGLHGELVWGATRTPFTVPDPEGATVEAAGDPPRA